MHGGATAAALDERPSGFAIRAARAWVGFADGRVLAVAGVGCLPRGIGEKRWLALDRGCMTALRAAEELGQRGLSATVVDARFAKPWTPG